MLKLKDYPTVNMHAGNLESITDWKIVGITCMHSRALEKCPERLGVICLLTGLQPGEVLPWHANTLLFAFKKEMPLFTSQEFCSHTQDP
jgi:hypothetical protein